MASTSSLSGSSMFEGENTYVTNTTMTVSAAANGDRETAVFDADISEGDSEDLAMCVTEEMSRWEAILLDSTATRGKLIEQKQSIISLKTEKADLLRKVSQLCSALEKKDIELDDFIRCYEKKAQETSQHIKQVGVLANELDNAQSRLQQLEKMMTSRSGTSGASSFSQTTQTSDDWIDAAYKCALEDAGSSSVVTGPLPATLSASLDSGHPESLGGHLEPSPGGGSAVETLTSTEKLCEFTPALRNLRSSRKASRDPGVVDTSISAANHSRPSDQDPPTILETGDKRLGLREEVNQMPTMYWTPSHVSAWLTDYVGMPETCVQKMAELGIDGKRLSKLTEKEMEKHYNVSETLVRRKLHLALDDLRVHGPPGYPHGSATAEAQIETAWVSDQWLSRELGLPNLRASFASRRVDGRVLASLLGVERKELSRLLAVKLSKHESSSLRTGIQLLKKLNFNVKDLYKRRSVAENAGVDPVVWSNQRLATWLKDNMLEKYTADFNTTGLHGAFIVLDSSFSASSLIKLLRIPTSVAKACLLDEKFQALIKPARLTERVKVKRSVSLFGSRRRSASQPRSHVTSSQSVVSNDRQLMKPGGVGGDQLQQQLSTPGGVNAVESAAGTGGSTEFVRGYRQRGESTGEEPSTMNSSMTPAPSNRYRMSFRNLNRKTSASEDDKGDSSKLMSQSMSDAMFRNQPEETKSQKLLSTSRSQRLVAETNSKRPESERSGGQKVIKIASHDEELATSKDKKGQLVRDKSSSQTEVKKLMPDMNKSTDIVKRLSAQNKAKQDSPDRLHVPSNRVKRESESTSTSDRSSNSDKSNKLSDISTSRDHGKTSSTSDKLITDSNQIFTTPKSTKAPVVQTNNSSTTNISHKPDESHGKPITKKNVIKDLIHLPKHHTSPPKLKKTVSDKVSNGSSNNELSKQLESQPLRSSVKNRSHSQHAERRTPAATDQSDRKIPPPAATVDQSDGKKSNLTVSESKTPTSYHKRGRSATTIVSSGPVNQLHDVSASRQPQAPISGGTAVQRRSMPEWAVANSSEEATVTVADNSLVVAAKPMRRSRQLGGIADGQDRKKYPGTLI